MNITYNFRSRYLLAFGIGFIILCVPSFIAIMIGIYNDFINTFATKNLIFIISILIGMPLIFSWGIYNIVQGFNQFEINFTETNFKVYKNLELKLDIPLEHVKRIKISHVNFFSNIGGFSFHTIEVEMKEMERFQLTIRGKKSISEFLQFIELLKPYCNEKQIPFIELYDDSTAKNQLFERLNLTDKIYKKIRDRLTEKEEIKYTYNYNPPIYLKRNIIMWVIDIGLLIIVFFLFITPLHFYLGDLLIIISSCAIFLLSLQLLILIIMKKDRNKLYIFTNQRIIRLVSRNFRFIEYKNVSFINRRNFPNKMYLIEIYLDKNFIDNSDFRSNKFVIPVIPYNSDLIIKLKHLIENVIKKEINITIKRDEPITYKKFIKNHLDNNY